MPETGVKQLNVILITVDALRPDRLGAYGHSRATDEALKPFLEHMALFRNAYTYSVPTMRSHPTIATSTWAGLCTSRFPWQYLKKISLPAHSRTIAEAFHSAGYHTLAHICWSNMLTEGQGYARGFDEFVGMVRQDGAPHAKGWRGLAGAASRRFIYSMRYLPSYHLVRGMERAFHWGRETVNALTGSNIQEPPGMSGRSGKAVADYVIHRLSGKVTSPFYIWANFHDVHMPLAPPAEFNYGPEMPHKTRRMVNEAIFKQKPIPEPLQRQLSDLYDGAVRFVCHQVRRIFDALKEQGLLDQTCVVLISDHGTGLWERGYWEYPEDRFFDLSLRVPLLIHHPGLTRSRPVIETPVSWMDLAPTILELAGLGPEKRFFGKSFAGLLTGDSAQVPDGDIWVETVGPPHRYCRIADRGKAVVADQKKIIYNRDKEEFVGGLDSSDQPCPLTPQDRDRFQSALKEYERKKAEFLQRLASA